jgi:hypothetical protein
MYDLRNKIGAVYAISIIAVGMLCGCSKSEPVSTQRSSSSPPEPQHISVSHPNNRAPSTPSPPINLGVVNVSVEKTNWFKIGTDMRCGITAVTNRLIQGQVVVRVFMLITNSSAGAPPQVTTETLLTTLMPAQGNLFSVDKTLIGITPVLKTVAAD